MKQTVTHYGETCAEDYARHVGKEIAANRLCEKLGALKTQELIDAERGSSGPWKYPPQRRRWMPKFRAGFWLVPSVLGGAWFLWLLGSALWGFIAGWLT